MAVTLYKSTDASAPSLTGQVGSLVALLDAILVNGYGTQAAAGWTKAFTGTNLASYRMGTTGNTGFYLDVNDAAPGTGGAKEARMRGYEAMTAVGTGTNAFPTSSQSSFGVVCRKSSTADTTARPWYCVADNSVLHLFVDTGDFTNPSYSFAFSFGDYFSYKSGDTYNSAIIGRKAENSTNDTDDTLSILQIAPNPPSTLLPGHYTARVWTGTGGSIQFSKFSALLAAIQPGNGNGTQYGPCGSSNTGCVYPNGPDGAIELAPIWIGHNGSVRGYLKGLWAPCHYQPCGHGDTFSGTGNMSGKSFLALNLKGATNNWSGTSSTSGQIIVETSNTWS